ncbi:MAG: cobalamin-dependent protein [Pseudomonadota bacterium]
MPAPAPAALRQAIIDGDEAQARALAAAVLAAGADPLAAIEEGFAEGLREVGRLWEGGEYFLPELIMGAEAMKAAMAVLAPALRTGGPARRGAVVIGTVQGDLHDIGKSLVATLLAAHGFEVHDLGADVPVEAFVARAREVGADLVAASALLTTTMPVQARLVAALRAAGLAAPVLVGGAPATAGWAAEIGAHFAENAQRAVEAAGRLCARDSG